MNAEEMNIYIVTLEKENVILKERNDKLYEQNCNQATIISRTLNDNGRYISMVAAGDFGGTKRVYNNIVASNTSSTTNFMLTPIFYT